MDWLIDWLIDEWIDWLISRLLCALPLLWVPIWRQKLPAIENIRVLDAKSVESDHSSTQYSPEGVADAAAGAVRTLSLNARL